MDIKDILKEGPDTRPEEYSPLTLAYIGDAVYELYIRTRLAGRANRQAGRLHREATRYVSAHAQSETVKAMLGSLTEREAEVFRRGRNAKSLSVPKNADVGEYHHATGFEALVGFLHLAGEKERLLELLDRYTDI